MVELIEENLPASETIFEYAYSLHHNLPQYKLPQIARVFGNPIKRVLRGK